jgi:hypothetical protein
VKTPEKSRRGTPFMCQADVLDRPMPEIWYFHRCFWWVGLLYSAGAQNGMPTYPTGT